MSDIIEYQIEWQKIKVQITYKKNYFPSAGVSHLELRAEEPLPMTETGYRSIWIMKDELQNTTIQDFVVDGLNTTSTTKKWQDYLKEKTALEIAKSQLSLF